MGDQNKKSKNPTSNGKHYKFFSNHHQNIMSIEKNKYNKKNKRKMDDLQTSLPQNTEKARVELCSRVQMKLKKMMKNTEYLLDPRWKQISNLASSRLHNAQKSAWILMEKLEKEKIAKSEREKIEKLKKEQIKKNSKISDSASSAHQLMIDHKIDDLRKLLDAAQREIKELKTANQQQSVENEAYKKFVKKFLSQNPTAPQLNNDSENTL